MTECHNFSCDAPASGEGVRVFICVHEHMVREGEYCRDCWSGHLPKAEQGVLHCSRCVFAPAPHGHDCVIRMLALSAVTG